MSEKFKVLLVGRSGQGKTYTSRTLNHETTGLVNVENKPLPFKTKFKYHIRPKNYKEAYDAIIEYAKNPDIDCIYIDSFSAYTDMVLLEARRTKKGFDTWQMYNEEIGKLLDLIKKAPKHILVTAHYDVIENVDGNNEKATKVKANEWKGLVEKEFTVVLFADSKTDEKGKPAYWYNTYQEGTTAKCPPELFEDIKVNNDGQYLVDKIKEFTGETVAA